jgi:hypothetical protein
VVWNSPDIHIFNIGKTTALIKEFILPGATLPPALQQILQNGKICETTNRVVEQV